MEWMIFGIASAFTFALVSVLDKIIISNYVPGGRVFVATVGVTQILLGLATIPLAISSTYSPMTVTIALLSGLFSGTYLITMFIIMESQDVSRVVPVVSTYPVFVAILASIFLGEHISGGAWICVLITVAGAALVSLSPSQQDSASADGRWVAMSFLFLASLSFGLSQFLSKTIADEMSLWGQYTLRALGGGLACFALVISGSVRQGLLSILKKPTSLAFIGLTEVLLVFFAILFFFLSIYSGDVYLTSTVMASRPLFVFTLTLVLSLPFIKLFKESMKKSDLLTRTTGIALTVGGVIGVSFL